MRVFLTGKRKKKKRREKEKEMGEISKSSKDKEKIFFHIFLSVGLAKRVRGYISKEKYKNY